MNKTHLQSFGKAGWYSQPSSSRLLLTRVKSSASYVPDPLICLKIEALLKNCSFSGEMKKILVEEPSATLLFQPLGRVGSFPFQV